MNMLTEQQTETNQTTDRKYLVPFILITSLFFLWGFARAILEGEDAIHRYRELMGATNPEKAAEGTIRKKYAVSLEANSVHGSDAPETAAFETRYFFSAFEIV